jgi:hypothetical protein
MPVRTTCRNQLVERGDVKPMVARQVELDGLAGGEQVGRIGLAIVDGPPQATQRLAQVVPGFRLRLFGPQQFGQRFSAMWGLGVEGQVN